MEVSTDIPELTEMQINNPGSNVNKRHAYSIAASWLLHEKSSRSLKKDKLKAKPNQKTLVLLNRF